MRILMHKKYKKVLTTFALSYWLQIQALQWSRFTLQCILSSIFSSVFEFTISFRGTFWKYSVLFRNACSTTMKHPSELSWEGCQLRKPDQVDFCGELQAFKMTTKLRQKSVRKKYCHPVDLSSASKKTSKRFMCENLKLLNSWIWRAPL